MLPQLEFHFAKPAEASRIRLLFARGSVKKESLLTRSLFQKLIGDDQFLNFRRAFIDAQRAHITVQPFNH